MNNLYDLMTVKSRGPVGLTRTRFNHNSLHQNVNRPTLSKINLNEMPPKTYTPSIPASKASSKPSDDVDLLAPPQSSSDEEDNVADIKPSVFSRKSERGSSASDAGTKKGKKANANGSKSVRIGATEVGVSSSLSSSCNPKRKSQEDVWRGKGTAIGGKMVDPFGRVNAGKMTKVYGSSQPRPSNQSDAVSKKARLSPASPPRTKKLVIPEEFDFDSSFKSQQDSPMQSKFFVPGVVEESPPKARTPIAKFEEPVKLEDSPIATPELAKKFRNPVEFESQAVTGIGSGDSFRSVKKEESPISSPLSSQILFQRPKNASHKRDPKALLDLKRNELGGELATMVGNIIGENDDDFGVESRAVVDDSNDSSVGAVTRCPMCGQPCNTDELKKWGLMDTRKQERFCRSHQKSTAEAKWSSKGYPEIDWEKLDSRISAHHEFIRSLLNGGDCHYRRTFEELVAAGKGRSLRKLDSNLTPGYYGSRGLNAISEYVVYEFSRLLSRRSVKDLLMSKRGTTAFVQSVIVPEVAVQLIKEDMRIDDVKARQVLVESAKAGELVHEEIRDVIEERLEYGKDEFDE